MKTLESKISWSVFVMVGSIALSGCYTVLQKSGYYSEFDDASEAAEATEEVTEVDSLDAGVADSDDQTIIINRYYDGPWYDNYYGYYPYRWTFGLGYGSWPYYYAGYYGWPYVGVYYNPWWNDYYYTGWCYYPRHYYGYYGHGYGHYGGRFDDDYNIRRGYTGRRTAMTGSGGALSGGSYSGTGTSVRETSDGSRSSGKGLNKNSSRKTGTKKAVRDGQRQTRIKNDGSGQGRSRETRGRETRRDGGSERGTRKNSDGASSGRRSMRFSFDSGYTGFGPSGQGNSFQRSVSSSGHFNMNHRSGSSGTRSGQASRRTGR